MVHSVYIYTKLRYESWTRLHVWLPFCSIFHHRTAQSVHHIQDNCNIWRPLMNGWTRPTSAASTACTSSSPCSTYTTFTTSFIINKPTHYKINRLVHKHFGDSCFLWCLSSTCISFISFFCLHIAYLRTRFFVSLYLFSVCVWYVLPLWRINVLITARKC